MARILLTGAKGQVGSDLERVLLQKGHEVIMGTRQALDITKADRVLSAILDGKPNAVINAAAYTNVERAESEPPLAYNVNALGVRNIAKACAQAHIPLIHISTDYVCANDLKREHTEEDPTEATCVYGKSKLAGEHYIIEAGCPFIIVRTSWVFGRFGRNFVKAMLAMGRERHEIAVVSDQLGNPTPVRPLAKAIVTMMEQALLPDFKDYGIYNYCGHDATTWDEFARLIFHKANELKTIKHQVQVRSILSTEFKSKAMRPVDSRLDCTKCQQVFKLAMPYWPDYIEEVITSFERERCGISPVEPLEQPPVSPEVN